MKGKAIGGVAGAVLAGAFAASTYFTPDEFSSPDELGSGVQMDSTFISMLDVARQKAGIPFVINSGYRSKSHNRVVGGVDGSAHTKGLAADIKVKSGAERDIILRALMDAGFTRIGIGNTFIHVDIDSTKAQNVIWTY